MITYTTQQGDTWDLISYRLFNTEMHTNDLFNANTEHKDIAIFEAGIVLNVPEIIVEQTQMIAPWLRGVQTGTDHDYFDEIPVINIEYNDLISYRLVDRHTLSVKNLILARV